MIMWRVVLALALVGCGAAAPSQPIGIAPADYDAAAMTLTELTAGGPVDLVFPPQGGFVLFVGGRVHGLSDGNVQMSARLLDPATQIVVAMDTRVVTLQHDPNDASTWQPDLRSYQNVPNVTMCPSTSTTDLFDVPLTLELTVTELTSKRVGTTTIVTVPSCRQSDAQKLALCKCECGGNWTPTKCSGI